MEFWTEVRRQVLVEGLSKRGACDRFGISWHTLVKILENEEPPGYRQTQPRRKPKIETILSLLLGPLYYKPVKVCFDSKDLGAGG